MQASSSSKFFRISLLFIFLLISAAVWAWFWWYGKYYVSTDDAYVNANIVQISPRISGKINKLHVANNQYVKEGDILFDIDDQPFQVAMQLANAQVNLRAAELEKASSIANRTETLVKTKFASPQDGDTTRATYRAALAALESAKASQAQAQLNLNYTQVKAPVSGWISNLSVRAGNLVMANQALFALINDDEFWIDANFKETQVTHILPGQKALITTDLYPDTTFEGVVESISGGTGTVFSILPPQNATGNWVKVTQRIPVRIRVLNPDKSHPLRVGISANVKVTLKENTQAAHA